MMNDSGEEITLRQEKYVAFWENRGMIGVNKDPYSGEWGNKLNSCLLVFIHVEVWSIDHLHLHQNYLRYIFFWRIPPPITQRIRFNKSRLALRIWSLILYHPQCWCTVIVDNYSFLFSVKYQGQYSSSPPTTECHPSPCHLAARTWTCEWPRFTHLDVPTCDLDS